MDLLQSIHNLPRIEKIKIMEFLWEELTIEEKKFDSPGWHRNALSETERRMAEGKEKAIDWSNAKKLHPSAFGECNNY